MKMERRHYHFIAARIADILDLDKRKWMCEYLGEAFAEANSGFKWSKWRKACKVGDNDAKIT